MSVQSLSIPVAILAGGLATRLRPLTEKVPKVLLPVAGKPFLAHQLALLKQQGIQEVILCVGHLGELIEREFGNGEKYGLRLRYAFDGPVLLGTGGALRQALPLLGEKFFVLYGDSYLPIPFRPVADFFTASGKLGLMTVYRNTNRYDTSNVWFSGGVIKVYDKEHRRPEMEHIDYGLSLFRAAALEAWPAGTKFDLAALMQGLLREDQLAGFEVGQRFYEIGSHSGLQELENYLRARDRDGAPV